MHFLRLISPFTAHLHMTIKKNYIVVVQNECKLIINDEKERKKSLLTHN